MKVMEFLEVEFWVQFHNMPWNHFTDAAGKVLAKRLGSFKMVDYAQQGFLRVQIGLDISKLLIGAFSFKCEDEAVYPISIKHERLDNYCYYCCKLDHDDSECEEKFSDKCKGRLVEDIQDAKGFAQGFRVDSPT